jgi:biopolymer transport protein ExbB
VKFDAAQPDSIVFAKRDGQNALVVGMAQGAPYVALTVNGMAQRAAAPAAVSASAWHHIAVTASDHVTLYVDGKPAGTVAAALPAMAGTGTIGADPGSGRSGGSRFRRRHGRDGDGQGGARPAGFIAAAFASQAPESAMVVYGADEENAGMSGGYFGVILRSVTIDGWVVIAILGVMMAVSVTVMINKAI